MCITNFLNIFFDLFIILPIFAIHTNITLITGFEVLYYTFIRTIKKKIAIHLRLN